MNQKNFCSPFRLFKQNKEKKKSVSNDLLRRHFLTEDVLKKKRKKD